MRILLCLFVFVLFVAIPPTTAGDAGYLYSQGRTAVKRGEFEFAFMYYRSVVRHHPHSGYARKSLFAEGEYYFSVPDYTDAGNIFQQYVSRYPDGKEKIFALAYLFRIAQDRQNQELMDKLKQEILAIKQVGFIFQDKKKVNYRSAFGNKYQAIYEIDKLTVLKGREPFV
ncbi:MAG: outer membrane protein assembly factor BamD, partial [Candidatus Omnitrophica bacterium]|nr:outer membrane protein assembly factor BamD [Candidatus Omnitrophota bacterium]